MEGHDWSIFSGGIVSTNRKLRCQTRLDLDCLLCPYSKSYECPENHVCNFQRASCVLIKTDSAIGQGDERDRSAEVDEGVPRIMAVTTETVLVRSRKG